MQMFSRTKHLQMSDEAKLARRKSIGGSDARIIASGDQIAIEKLWAEKRGEVAPEDLSDSLVVQLGNTTEPLNLDWFEKDTGFLIVDAQKKFFFSEWEFAHATVDGLVTKDESEAPFAVFEAKFMLPFNFSKEKAIEKYYPQLQHNMLCVGLESCFISIITGGGQYFREEILADAMYQYDLLKMEKDFWDCVQTGRTPGNPKAPVPDIERIKVVDMSANNEWADLAFTLVSTKTATDKHEKAKKEIKKLFPADAAEASGRGVKIALSKDKKQLITIDKDEVAKTDALFGATPPVAENDNVKTKKSRKKAA